MVSFLRFVGAIWSLLPPHHRMHVKQFTEDWSRSLFGYPLSNILNVEGQSNYGNFVDVKGRGKVGSKKAWTEFDLVL